MAGDGFGPQAGLAPVRSAGYDAGMHIISSEEALKIASQVASANLTPEVFKKVLSESAVDSGGHDALRLTIVIANNSVDQITGDVVLDTLVKIQQGLEKAGDERLAIIDYASEEELSDASGQS
jgi:hypothetical protein